MTAGAGLAICLVGFALRAWALAGPSFWYDEAYSAITARRSPAEIVATITREDFHPPLHYVLFKAWSALVGEGEYQLRFVSALAGTLTIAVAFALGHRLFGRSGGLTSAILVAASPYLVYYSSEARMFGIASLIGLVTLFSGHHAVRLRSLRSWAITGVLLTLGVYNFYYALFVLLPVGALALLHGRRAVAGFAVAIGVAVLLYLPWLPVLIGRAGAWTDPWTPATTPARVLAWTWPALLTGVPAVELWDIRPVAASLVAVAVLAAITVTFGALTVPTWRRGLLYSAAAVLLPLGAIAIIALVRPIYHPRYAVVAAAPLFIVLAGALCLPSSRVLVLRAALALAVAGSSGFGLYRHFAGDGLQRDDYRGAVAYIDSRAQAGDTAISNALAGLEYYERSGLAMRHVPAAPYTLDAIATDLTQIARGRSRVWYLTHALHASDPEGFVDGLLRRWATLEDERSFGHLKVALFSLAPGVSFSSAVRPIDPMKVGDYLELTGLGLAPLGTGAGGVLPIALQWRVMSRPREEIGIWARLRDDQGFEWGRLDRRPRDDQFRTPTAWEPGGSVVTGHLVPVVHGAPPGNYQIEVGVYRLADLGGLEFRGVDGTSIGRSAVVGQVWIERDVGRGPDPTLAGPARDLDSTTVLEAVGLSTRRVRAGDSLEMTLLWQVRESPGTREVLVRLLGPGGGPVAERRFTAGMGRYTPERWVGGDRVRDQVRFSVPPTLAAGQYTLSVGLVPRGSAAPVVDLASIDVEAIQRRTDAPSISNPVSVSFEDGIVLGGWDARPTPTGTTLVLYWHPTTTPVREYKVFVHFVGTDGKIAAQSDAVPARWSRPTNGWIAGEWIEDTHEVTVPRGADPLTVRVGVYDPITGSRLRATDGRDYVDLTRLAN